MRSYDKMFDAIPKKTRQFDLLCVSLCSIIERSSPHVSGACHLYYPRTR